LSHVFTTYTGSPDAVLKDVTLKIPHGTLVVITGPNGSGKTTLLELILGFLKPLVGDVFVLGWRMPKYARKVRSQIGYLPQNFMRNPNEPYTAREVILMGLANHPRFHEKSLEQFDSEINSILKLLHIRDLLDIPIGKLSGGQQQKIMLARALIRKPKLLLLDEPFSSLDPQARSEVATLLYNIKRRDNMTILIVSHVIKPIQNYYDGLIELYDGNVVREEWIS